MWNQINVFNEQLQCQIKGALLKAVSVIVLLLIMGQFPTATDWNLSTGVASAADANVLYGQITGKRQNEIQIDQKTYPLDPNIVVQDDEGKPREIESLPVGTRISYHLKNERIDRIVLVLSR
jgi:hypothetical protein